MSHTIESGTIYISHFKLHISYVTFYLSRVTHTRGTAQRVPLTFYLSCVTNKRGTAHLKFHMSYMRDMHYTIIRCAIYAITYAKRYALYAIKYARHCTSQISYVICHIHARYALHYNKESRTNEALHISHFICHMSHTCAICITL